MIQRCEELRFARSAREVAVYCPGSRFRLVFLDFPVSLGSYKYSRTPDDPIVIHMNWVPTSPGLPPSEQFKRGRGLLLRTSFAEIERTLRVHLAGMLGAAGFDPGEDILGITVNRHPHGYAHEEGSYLEQRPADGESPHVVGRKPLGRVAIANSDAGARAYLDEAVDQAWRAVSELVEGRPS
jgi:spermidine dehydrogenase